jgi:cytochrome c oxidase subunit 2
VSLLDDTKNLFEDLHMKLKYSLPAILIAILAISPTLIPVSAAPTTPRHIAVTAKRFGFRPSEITLKKGEPVVLVLKSADVPHGVRFKELGVEASAGKGQTVEAAFTPNKTGTFVGHCSVFCGSGHGGMTLTLNVVE